MPNILLRDILEAGLCGGYTSHGGLNNLGRARFELDHIAASGKFDGFDQESVRIQLANQRFISFENQAFFHKNLEGLLNNSAYFNPTDHEWIHDSVKLDGTDYEIKFVVIRDKTAGNFIEPVYDFVTFQSFIPMHSLIAAYLMGLEKVTVDPISLMAGEIESKMWIVDKAQIGKILADWHKSIGSPGHRSPSGACLSCTQIGCSWKAGFEQRVYDWMKAKQTLDGLEATIKEHITYNGPAKVGAHLVYMKENKRRSLDPEKRGDFLKVLQEHRPNDWVNLLNPDAAEIFRLAKKGLLPKELLEAFKESKSYTLDTTLTL